MNFVLRFPKQEIEYWANRYGDGDKSAIESGKQAQSRGHFIKSELICIAGWKSPRRKALCEKNADAFIQAVTCTARNTSDERLRIEVLTLLDGAGWPIASAMLHLAHSEPYPILDFRAFWSLGIPISNDQYNIDLWQDYTRFCRNLAADAAVSMRTLDRSLWQYSKEHQTSGSTE